MRYLKEIILPDAMKALTNGGELSAFLLAFSIVDYLAGYFSGGNSREKDFSSFLQEYFPSQYKPYIKDIYQHLRSGLVHNLTLKSPWFQSDITFVVDKKSINHLDTVDGKVIFSIYHFIVDADRAAIMYFHDLIMKPDENTARIQKFHKRFNKQDGTASVMVKTE
jgi:hypothetical protein